MVSLLYLALVLFIQASLGQRTEFRCPSGTRSSCETISTNAPISTAAGPQTFFFTQSLAPSAESGATVSISLVTDEGQTCPLVTGLPKDDAIYALDTFGVVLDLPNITCTACSLVLNESGQDGADSCVGPIVIDGPGSGASCAGITPVVAPPSGEWVTTATYLKAYSLLPEFTTPGYCLNEENQTIFQTPNDEREEVNRLLIVICFYGGTIAFLVFGCLFGSLMEDLEDRRVRRRYQNMNVANVEAAMTPNKQVRSLASQE